MKRPIKILLFTLVTLIVSVVTFFTFNLVFSAVSNYENVTRVILSLFPMFFFMCELVTLMMGAYYFFLKKRRDPYFFRQYSITLGVFALLGIVFSILTGTVVYHGFFKENIFDAYPFIMLLAHAAILGLSLRFAIPACKTIAKEKPEKTFIVPKLYFVRMMFLVLIFVYALERLGAFTLLPVYYSDVDGAVVIPYFIQLLVPTLILVTYVIHEDFLRNRKVTIILSSIAFGYSLFSMIYMLCVAHNAYPLTINPLSAINQFERLIRYPISHILLYGLSLLLSGLNLLNNVIMIIKGKRKNER